MIATSRQPAVRASVPTIRKGLWHVRSTEACLRSAASIGGSELSPGTCSLVRETEKEQRPCSVVDGLCQHSGGESLNIQIFNRNQSEPIDNLARFFVSEISSLVANVGVGPLEQLHRFAATIALLVGTPRNLALAAPQPGLCLPVVARVLNLRSIRKNREAVQANVDAYLFYGYRKGLRLDSGSGTRSGTAADSSAAGKHVALGSQFSDGCGAHRGDRCGDGSEAVRGIKGNCTGVQAGGRARNRCDALHRGKPPAKCSVNGKARPRMKIFLRDRAFLLD